MTTPDYTSIRVQDNPSTAPRGLNTADMAGEYSKLMGAGYTLSGNNLTAPAPKAPVQNETAQNTDPNSPSRPILYGGADEPTLKTAQSTDQIQSEKLSQAQGTIDNLNKYYDSLVNESKVLGDSNMRKTNAVSALTGLSGSTEAGVQSGITEKANAADINKVNQERSVAVGNILSKIQTDAVEEAKQSRLEARQSEQDRLAYRTKAQESANQSLAALSKGGSGVTLDGLKATLSPEEYNTLVTNAGGESMAKAIIFANRPQQDLVGTPTNVGGHMVQYYKKPDGSIASEAVPLPDGVTADQVQSVTKGGNGESIIIKKDGTWTKIPGTGKSTGGDSSVVSTSNPVTGKTVNVPISVAPYVNTSTNGVTYADLSAIQGTAAEKKEIVDSAQKAGLKIILNKNTAADLVNIQDANSKLDTIGRIMTGIGQPSALARDLGGIGLTKLSVLAQTNSQKAAAGALQSVGLDILKAMSGVQGFRGNSTVVQQINDHMPTINDTVEVANQKVDYIRQLISDREDGIVGKPDKSSGEESNQSTKMTGPDGKLYDVPNDQVEAFKKAGGH